MGDIMYMKLEQELSKGFESWAEMLRRQDKKLIDYGLTCIFAGSEKENDNTMMVIMAGTQEAFGKFKADEELAKERAEAGAILETTKMTPMTGASIVNYPLSSQFDSLKSSLN